MDTVLENLEIDELRRLVALDQAVRSAHSNYWTTEDIIQRAIKFETYISKKDSSE